MRRRLWSLIAGAGLGAGPVLAFAQAPGPEAGAPPEGGPPEATGEAATVSSSPPAPVVPGEAPLSAGALPGPAGEEGPPSLLPPAPDSYGLAGLWAQGDFVAHATLILLVLMSVASWTVIVLRTVALVRLGLQASRATRVFWSAAGLEAGLNALRPRTPYHRVAEAALAAEEAYRSASVQGVDRHTWLSTALSRSIAGVQAGLQEGQTLLATVGATAPFVGLFGTVWGIHHALTAIGVSGEASIDKVAGPVGEALVMTALGLLVAVPAVLAYNGLARANKRAVDRLKSFAADLYTVLLGGHRLPDGEGER
ncbi:MotA/TolQ/ExbB proton channel family protein [Pararhodospirillum oryzae]|uniref:Biopolymer transport protein ExbB n=1 Tax=Pararhodospirillum oryzae TaxID=478448 RepID=A0A512HC76_9PROT|nr:MotA/TolQ/ExbB proton channel family protein [Pararhodospirillum oryzae]GEO83043.1 hypothetical protein ROR02_31740 [Pararhodospirillum oryzae]